MTAQLTGASPIPALTVDALRDAGVEPLARYERMLADACALAPPPYGMAWYGDRYREVASDPAWLAGSLVANAAKEGEGSRKLWSLAGRAADRDVAAQVRQHAIDESRHARFYIALLELAFPEAADEALLEQFRALSPGYGERDTPPASAPSPDALVHDEIVQMNIGEIRTRIHQLLLRPVLAVFCPQENRPRLQGVLDALLTDETRHIAYTARIIDRAAAGMHGPALGAVMNARLAEFNAITLREVGAGTFASE
ncbi:MAG: hypothetical protein QOI11_3399 [Candidatus Eremiobacteraeota bacterium]|nr:hypothetical protein [Candidatus Eremiobacteraeota bacterium]